MHAHWKATMEMPEIHIANKIGVGMTPDEVALVHEVLDSYFRESKIKLVYHV